MTDQQYKPTWTNRRRTIFGSLVFDALIVAAVITGWLFGIEVNASVAAIVSALVVKDLAIIASYVFGAAWEDIQLWKP